MMQLEHDYISQNLKTPCYVFDLDVFARKLRAIKGKLGSSISLCYSLKANPWLARTAFESADYIETCSEGEVAICAETSSAQMPRVIYGGVAKDEGDIAFSLEKGVVKFSIESARQLQILDSCAAKVGIVPKVLLRLTSGNQFGMEPGEVLDMFSNGKMLGMDHIEFVGVHYYSGTQRLDVKSIERDFANLKSHLDTLSSLDISEVEYGCGIGVDFFGGKDNAPLWERVAELLNELSGRYQVTYESGRALAADCGSYVTRINEVRERPGKIYYITDGGKHQLSYYTGLLAKMKVSPLKVIPFAPASQSVNGIVCGSLCTVGDILANASELPRAREGDYIIFEQTGAYSITENIALFLSRDMPSVYSLQADQLTLLRGKIETWCMNMPHYQRAIIAKGTADSILR